MKETDKSGRFTIDSLENYSEFISVHSANDDKVDIQNVEYLETKLNDNLRILNRIFNVGCDTNQRENEEHVHLVSISSNSSIPVMDGVCKDHKTVSPDHASARPPIHM